MDKSTIASLNSPCWRHIFTRPYIVVVKPGKSSLLMSPMNPKDPFVSSILSKMFIVLEYFSFCLSIQMSFLF